MHGFRENIFLAFVELANSDVKSFTSYRQFYRPLYDYEGGEGSDFNIPISPLYFVLFDSFVKLQDMVVFFKLIWIYCIQMKKSV